MKTDIKSTVEKVSNLQRKLNVEVPATTVSSAFDSAFKEVQKQAHIKGFRPGKAPIATIKSLYGARVVQDVVQDLVQKHYALALKQHQLAPINYPEFEFDAPSEDKSFSFSANFEVRPDIILKKYEGLEVEKEKFEFEEKRITDILENIRNAQSTFVEALDHQLVEMGDRTVIDFEGFVDGKPLEHGAGTDHQLEIGAKQFIEGFEEGLVGMKVGGNATLNLKFPDPYQSAELAGKAVEFKVTLKGLKKRALPELNDELVAKVMGDAANVGKHTVESLKKTIREDIEQTEKKRIETDYKNRVLKKLVQANPVDVPPSLLKEQKQALVDDTKNRMLEQQQMSEEQFKEYQQKWDKDFEQTASEMIQSGFILDAIAEKHNLKWTEDDIEKKFNEYAAQTGLELQKIKDWYARPEQHSRLTYMITEEKVLSYLGQSIKVKEVAKKELKDLN